MKSIANRIFLFAAAALSLGTAAYGQEMLSANVPFAFRVLAGKVSAGQYTVRIENSGGGYIAEVRDRAARHAVLSFAHVIDSRDSRGGTTAPRLVFRCGETGCQLSEIWTLTGGFSVPVKHVRDHEYLASVPFTIAGD